jgi:hypothetical protein
MAGCAMHHVNDEIADYWNDDAYAHDAEPDHRVGDLGPRAGWRVLLERWLQSSRAMSPISGVAPVR